jgi:hypothetical protein
MYTAGAAGTAVWAPAAVFSESLIKDSGWLKQFSPTDGNCWLRLGTDLGYYYYNVDKYEWKVEELEYGVSPSNFYNEKRATLKPDFDEVVFQCCTNKLIFVTDLMVGIDLRTLIGCRESVIHWVYLHTEGFPVKLYEQETITIHMSNEKGLCSFT